VFEQTNQTMEMLLDAAQLIEQQQEQIDQLQHELNARDDNAGDMQSRTLM